MSSFEPCRIHETPHDHFSGCLHCEFEALRADRKRLLAENEALKQRLMPIPLSSQPLHVVYREAIGKH